MSQAAIHEEAAEAIAGWKEEGRDADYMITQLMRQYLLSPLQAQEFLDICVPDHDPYWDPVGSPSPPIKKKNKKKKNKKLKHARSKAEVVRTITACLSLILQCYIAYRVTKG